MYYLENNVAWTDELKNAFKHGVTRCQIGTRGYLITESGALVQDNDGNNIIVTGGYDENSKLISAELLDYRNVPNLGFIGQATAKQLTVRLQSSDYVSNMENKEFTFKIGADYEGDTYYINYGNFIVDKAPKNDDTNGQVEFVAYDYMIKFNKLYNPSNSLFPCTLAVMFTDLCNQAGVGVGSTNFANKDFIVDSNQWEGKTCREVLQYIGMTAFSWARIKQDNKCYLDFVAKDENDVEEIITKEEYKTNAFKKANEYYGAINKVTYGQVDIQGQEESVEDSQDIELNGTKELILYDNLFAYTTAKRHTLIQAGTRLLGLKYMPVQQMDLIGLVYLDSNDYVEIQDMEENPFYTYVLNHSISYNGAVSDSITSEAQSLNEQTYTNTNASVTSQKRTEIIVDRAKGEILQVAEDISDLEQATSSLVQNSTEILSTVTYVDNNKNNINNISTIDQKADNILLEVKTIANDNLVVNSNVATGNFNSWRVNTEINSQVWQGYDKYWIHLWNNDTSLRWFGAWQDIYTNVIENTKYTISFEAFCVNANNNKLRIDVHNDDASRTILELVSHTFDLTTTPDRYSFTFTSHAGTKMFSMLITSADYVAFDFAITNIKLEQGEYVTPWIENTADHVKSMINISPESVLIQANKINLTANDIINLIAGNTINLTSKNIVISSTNFSVDASGNMTANSGLIGGWTLVNTKFYGGDGVNTKTAVMQVPSANTNWVFASGGSSHNDYSDCPFRVSKNGELYATNATITGNVTASSGQIGGWTITDYKILRW